ncbi:MAG: hypothetical protein LYZ70_07145 [Nitrososphaerales archaeon]|nr:hypothetical protein [Nitrososphaerales archaeon]
MPSQGFGVEGTCSPALHELNLVIGEFTPQLKEVPSLLIVISSAALGTISAKMVDFTVRNTPGAFTDILVATVAAFLSGQLNIASLVHI